MSRFSLHCWVPFFGSGRLQCIICTLLSGISLCHLRLFRLQDSLARFGLVMSDSSELEDAHFLRLPDSSFFAASVSSCSLFLIDTSFTGSFSATGESVFFTGAFSSDSEIERCECSLKILRPIGPIASLSLPSDKRRFLWLAARDAT